MNAAVDAMDATGKTPLDYAESENETIIDTIVVKLESDLQASGGGP
jgi:hypothetical protein